MKSKFTDATKKKIVKEAASGWGMLKATSIKYNVSPLTISIWTKKFSGKTTLKKVATKKSIQNKSKNISPKESATSQTSEIAKLTSMFSSINDELIALRNSLQNSSFVFRRTSKHVE